MATACLIRVRGTVQGVGFRPFIYRLARKNMLKGWVLNGDHGVEIHLEGAEDNVTAFVREMRANPPAAAQITEIRMEPAPCEDIDGFTIRASERHACPTVRISPDLPVCGECLAELFDPFDQRYGYPYINCTNCGPRYSVILALPYDRLNTTMRNWPMDRFCRNEYHDPGNRRFHAQPVACPDCGPNYFLCHESTSISQSSKAIADTARMLREGRIVTVKGLGGYHLACDARNPESNMALRERKFRKEKPFAVMAKNLETARHLVHLSSKAEALLTSAARPIVLAPGKQKLSGVAPGNDELGVMLPYTPLHHLLFAADAPDILVMTSANRSSEPIAYEDKDALQRLSGIADAFLVGERRIARRVDDSVVRIGAFGPMVLRRGRGYAPAAVATLPITRPVLALGADLKNTITLVVGGEAFVSQHIGDLEHYQAIQSFQEVVRDMLFMYEVRMEELLVVHDLHPQYASSAYASTLPSANRCAVQHHRAHIASVLAERAEFDERVIGVSFDGTGYGDDATIWGGEIFVGSLRNGFERIAHLRQAALAGGDAAAQFPIQAAAGFVSQLDSLPDLTAAPFHFGPRYRAAMQLIDHRVRTFSATSMGRLFDAAAALLGFIRETTFEGQPAIWLEQLAGNSSSPESYPFPFAGNELDFRPLLSSVVSDRIHGRPVEEIARVLQRGIAEGIFSAIKTIAEERGIRTVVLSGGVFQNGLLLEDLKPLLESAGLRTWTNRSVPPNDGGISLGQAALAVFQSGATLHA